MLFITKSTHLEHLLPFVDQRALKHLCLEQLRPPPVMTSEVVAMTMTMVT
jgi:hypothetical protein